MKEEMGNIGIPTVDMARFRSGSEEERTAFIKDLGRAYEEVGFVAVVNHGVNEGEVSRFYDLVQAFFALPEEVKRRYEIPGLFGQRGYTSFGREHAKGSDAPDLKEFYQIGQTVAPDDELRLEYLDNVPVKELPEFLETGVRLFKSFEESGSRLLQAIALFLGLGEHYFDSWVERGNSILRAIHYPPITAEPKSAIRAEQHEDINLITLLVGASAEGLQVQTLDGKWVDVMAPEGYIVVNVGDMLQRLTNGRLRSTTHRVVNPPRERWHTHRYSIPFFLHPRSDMPLNVLDSCVSDERPPAFEDITAGAYLDERLREIGLKK